MESVVKTNCQWKGCGSEASKHAVVGMGVFEAGEHSPDEHFDLCEKHLELARLQYMYSREYPLGKCPEPSKDLN